MKSKIIYVTTLAVVFMAAQALVASPSASQKATNDSPEPVSFAFAWNNSPELHGLSFSLLLNADAPMRDFSFYEGNRFVKTQNLNAKQPFSITENTESYDFCMAEDPQNPEQGNICYQLQLNPKGMDNTIRAFIPVYKDQAFYILKLSGSTQYEVSINGDTKVYDTPSVAEQSITLKLNAGDNIVNIFAVPVPATLQEIDAFAVYPIPSSGVVSVQSKKEQDIVAYRVFDTSGTLLKNKTLNAKPQRQMQLDFSDLSDGIYILECIDTKQQSTTQKIIIQKNR